MQQLLGGQPFQQATVTLKFKMASKMAAIFYKSPYYHRLLLYLLFIIYYFIYYYLLLLLYITLKPS